MPIYPYKCPEGHEFDRLRSATEPCLGVCACPECGETALQDYSRKNLLPPVIDGPSPGYYASDTGWPKDPTNPAKRICPGKRAVRDYNMRKQGSEDNPKGGFLE